MPRYQTNYTRDGINFTQIDRIGNVCLLKGAYQHTPDHHTYEVHILRMKPAHPESADAGKQLLMSPSTEEWGIYGWTYLTLQDAVKRFTAEVEKRRSVA
jgi:hypothetical protein